MPVSNHEFGRKVGCNYTMASRLRNGARSPSAQMLVKICNAFDLDHGEALREYSKGKQVFAAWLRAKVFEAGADEDQADEEGHRAVPLSA